MIRSTILSLTLLFVLSQSAGADEPKSPIGAKPLGQPAAQGEARPANPQPTLISNAFGGGKSAAEWYIERTDKVVKLSEAQKSKITELFAAREKAMQEFQSGLEAKAKAASAALGEAMKSKDQERIAREQKAYQELYAPMQAIYKKSEAALQNVLTQDQREKLNHAQIAMLVKSLTPGVEVSEEQLTKIKDKVGTLAGGEWGERKVPEAVEQVLTGMQISTIIQQRTKAYLTGMFGPAQLTPEQHKKIDAKVGELTRSQRKLTEFDAKIYTSLQEFVNGLLTSEQKEAQQKRGFWAINAPGQPAAGASPQIAVDGKTSQPQSQNVKVTQVPGGGVQVIIQEGAGEGRRTGQAELEQAQKQLSVLLKQTEASGERGMRERVSRQLSLAKQANKLLKKLDNLDADNKKERHKLSEELERVQGQLRQTFPSPQSASPLQPLGGWQQMPTKPGQVANALPGAPLTRTNPPASGGFITLQPGASAPQVSRPQGGSDLQQEVQSLRRQLEELREQVKKLSERGSK